MLRCHPGPFSRQKGWTNVTFGLLLWWAQLLRRDTGYFHHTIVGTVSDSLDIPAMLARFRERAKAVKQRPMPPVEGPERKLFIDRAQTDFMDFAIIGDAEGTIEDGILVLRIDLRPS